MSDNSKKPSHLVYTVRETDKDNRFWSRIGSAFPHKDGKGFSVLLEALPVDGKLTIRAAEAKET